MSLLPSRNSAWVQSLGALDNDHITRLFMASAVFMAAAFLITIPAWLIDERLLDNAAIWTKPQKFNVSLTLHFVTLAVLAQLVPRNIRQGPVMLAFGYMAVFAMILETLYIHIQAARGVRSHYNDSSILEQVFYGLMGIGAVVLIAVALVLAVQIWRKGDRSRPGLWLGAIVGLTTGFVSTLIIASYLSSVGRYVGAPLSGGGEVVPFFGWSREYGDLRPAHFVSMHLMQTIPLAGWVADKRGWNVKAAVFGVTAVQIALAVFLFMQARAGQPFWPV